MKTIQLVLTTEDAALEQKIKILEERCEKLDLSFPCVLEAVALTIPTKQFIEILLMYTDDKIHEIEQAEKLKAFGTNLKRPSRSI